MTSKISPPQPQSITDSNALDAVLASLQHRKSDWVKVSIPQRLGYLQTCLDRTLSVAEAWTRAACQAKGIDPSSTLAGEEWITGPISTVRNLRLLMTSLKANGQLPPARIDKRDDGRSIARVIPANLLDRVLWLGYRGEVWIEPGQPATQGQIYRESTVGQVSLILGAGNVSAIVAMDVLSKLFAENQVAIVKMNPVNAYVGEYLAQAFAPLVEAGFLQIVYGGAEVGEYLCQHPQVDAVHVTGSHRTHHAIVWGSTPAEQQERKAANDPRITKPITSELGCVTPILVVPGNWSKSDLAFQSCQVAATVAHNASFNCASGQVLVTASGWAQRDEFLAAVRRELAQTPARQAYYPGAQERYQTFLDKYPQSEPLGTRTDRIVPWTLIPDVSSAAGEYALVEEAFCGVLAEVKIESQSAPEFLTKAVEFANDRVWGTLSCTVLIDRATQQQCQSELNTAIAKLKYGAIGINIWSAMLFYFGSTTWGAYPGNTLADIGSGIGCVHNSYLFDYPQKSVVYAPFRIFPTPAWFATHKNLLGMARKLLKFEAYPTWANLPGVVLEAIKDRSGASEKPDFSQKSGF
jgi:acyl-CoA reductase-like NAD-dependent aldehyde dehydrogenase